MKIQILCVLLVLLSCQIWANYDVIPATLVKKKGGMLIGDIKHDANHELTKGVLFINKVDGSKSYIGAAEIQSLTLYDHNKFISHEIVVDNKVEHRLLHVINAGRINFYVFYSRSNERFFLQKDSGEITELVQKDDYIKSISGKENNFRAQLTKLIFERSELLPQIDRLNFKKSSISKLIMDYNTIFGESTVNQKQKDFKMNLAVGMTYILSNRINEDDFGNAGEGLSSFTINVEFAMYDPNISNSFAVHVGARYTMATYNTGTQTLIMSTIDQNGNAKFENEEVTRSTVTETVFGVPVFVRMNRRKRILSPLIELGAFIGSGHKMESFTGSGSIRESKFGASTPFINAGLAVNLSEKHFVSLLWGSQYKFAAKAELRF